MDRLIGSANLMIVSDLDYTMVDHDDPENLALLRFNALWEAYYRHNSLLVFSTGRSPTIYKELRKQKPLLTPDITIMSVGTEITYGESMVPDDGWKQYLDHKWDRDIVIEETAKFPELVSQSETEQRPHKVSFNLEKGKASKVMQALSKCLENRGLDVKIIYSNSIALDVLPQAAGKGQALSFLLGKLKAGGIRPLNTLVCGDSGNDAELFSVPEVYGVMVGNAQEELVEWYAENARDNAQIIHATERCAAGIMQAIGNFTLGPNMSPRDVRDSTLNIKILSPSHEVVMFYLLYERWLRGEVDNSEQYIQNIKSVFHSTGNVVHPSGVERPMQQIIDTLPKLFGEKRGLDFRVWIDRVSFAEVSLGSWLVKFDKWELSGTELRCCLTKVLMNSKVEAPNEFTWMHLHQTWLDGSEGKDDNSWFI
ncbi:putative sucrose-phosphate phosphatase [Medicago truncatula]|uniref:Sucrose-phosphatase n=1 Tax=Medicago truncatula TaxID=3880 RepID=G7IDI2_MEDTR|nr:sucrose-phosphatase 1 [Medicago truncatula]XP_024631378.1 sucrose-phosphatase 1 [Medicago truncatula]AES60113.2 sucrose phosphate phosphatase [Medicago truncatula]RHN78847.1 putative sucrose-phosphate phosphatase [Medicago truncatula]